jgi:hypothetical protein
MKLIIILFEIFVLAFVIGYFLFIRGKLLGLIMMVVSFFFIIALADGASTENKNTEQHGNKET